MSPTPIIDIESIKKKVPWHILTPSAVACGVSASQLFRKQTASIKDYGK